MTTDFFVGYGARRGRIYELDDYGIPKPTATTPYIGVKIKGFNGFQATQGNVRKIQHFDGDSVSLTQVFPSTDVPSGTITVDGADLSLNAILSNVGETTISGMKILPIMSDQQGSEPSVGMILQQAAKTDEGADGFHVQFINSSQAVPQTGSFGTNNYETTFQMAPSRTTHHLFGPAYDPSTDKVAAAAGDQVFSPNEALITCWLGDGATLEFDFAANFNSADNTFKLYQSVAGVVTEITSNVTKATDKVTFGAGHAPASGVTILAIHQIAS
jgi:hypothetical protein